MAFTKIHFNDGLSHGRLLRSAINHLEDGRDGLNQLIAATQLMIDGDGSQITHFDEVMTRYGFPSTTVAKAAWEELLAVQTKINTNASVSNVLAALDQAFAKFR
jgi:hypothetical protein